jgi:hypothetical protein
MIYPEEGIAVSTGTAWGDSIVDNSSNWNTAYNNSIVSAEVTGTTTKTLTLDQQDGGTITASWTDYDTAPVTSVFGRTGAVVAVSGDYTTAQVTESGNLYFTDARARAAISLTTLGTSGAATYNNTTGVLNIPNYTTDLTGYVPYTGATTNVNLGVHSLSAYDLIINHTSGSGVAASITKGGNGEALTVVKSSGSGNAASITGGVTLLSELHLTTDLADAYIASAANWNTAYTNRITSLTTTGSSGAATLISNTLNVPNYTLAGLGGQPLATNLTSLAALTYASTSFVKMTAAGTFALDTNTYALASALGNYLPLVGGTMSGGFTITNSNDTYTTPASTNVPNIYLYNTGATTTSNSVIALRTSGPTGGDPFISWDINGVLGWSAGIDNSDADKFKISKSWSSVDTNTYFTIDTSGNSSFAGTITATNFSGSSSGTNTGDQDLSGYLTTSTANATFLKLTGGTLTNTGGNGTPILNFASSATSAFQWITSAFNASVGTGNTMVHFIGQAASTKNSGYLGYVWIADQSDSNFLSLGFFNNDNLFRLYANGNLGIGVTSNAGYKLDVNGAGRFSGVLRVEGNTDPNSATAAFFWNQPFLGPTISGYNFEVRTGGTGSQARRLFINENGAATFSSSVTTLGGVLANGYTTGTTGQNLEIGYVSASNLYAINALNRTTGSVGYDKPFYIDAQTLIFNNGSSGNVLIRTGTGVTGGGALQVNGNVNINGAFQINGVTIGGGGGSGVTGSGTTNYIPKWSGSTSLSNSVMYDSGSNISIGSTSNNGTKLQVYSAVTGETPAIDALVSGNGRFMRALRVLNSAMTAGTDLMLSLGKSESARNMGQFYFYWAGDNSAASRVSMGMYQLDDVFNLFGSGNIAIGTTTDGGYKLYVSGTIGSTGGFFDTSDSRLKTLIEDNYLLSSIANVKSRLYIKDGRKELGYYAQDLEAILPSAVKEGADGFLSLSYAQVHTAKIAVIEDKVTILENEVAELKSKLQKYEA